MASVWIDRPCGSRRDLPDVCARCGVPTTDRVKHTFFQASQWTFFVGGLIGMILEETVGKKCAISVPLCAKHQHQWGIHRLLINLGGLGFLVGGGLLLAVYLSEFWPMDSLWSATSPVWVGVGIFLWLMLIAINRSSLQAEEIASDGIRLGGVHEEFRLAYRDHGEVWAVPLDDDSGRRERVQPRRGGRATVGSGWSDESRQALWIVLGVVGVALVSGLGLFALVAVMAFVNSPPAPAGPAAMAPPAVNFPPPGERIARQEPQELPPALPPARGDELIHNGDFSQGAKGFTTAYRQSANIRPEFTFSITSNPHKAHSDAPSFADHTGGKGMMLVANANTDACIGSILWKQQVVVKPGCDYEFSFWIALWYRHLPAEIEARINGKSLGLVTASNRNGEWNSFKANWNAGTQKMAVVEIVSLRRAAFTLDDISLRGPRPE